MKLAGIYARVSSRDQDPRSQLKELRTYASRRDFKIAHELVEKESGAKTSRPELDELMELARKRKVDVVLVWSFDRFGRSTQHLLQSLEEFHALGVDFVSYRESIDTTTPIGKAMYTITAAFAEFERSMSKERQRRGIEAAQARGVRFGRSPVPKRLVEEIRRLREDKKLGIRAIAELTGVSKSSVGRYLQERWISGLGACLA